MLTIVDIELARFELASYLARCERKRQAEECRQARRQRMLDKAKDYLGTAILALLVAGAIGILTEYICWFFQAE
jgi:hypothetical protein